MGVMVDLVAGPEAPHLPHAAPYSESGANCPAFQTSSSDLERSNSIITALRFADQWVRSAVDTKFFALLTPLEFTVQQYVDSLAFAGDAWYRPIHNRVVPLVMRSIIAECGASRDMMLVAQLHDVGYARVKQEQGLAHASWSDPVSREAHARFGAEMTRDKLRELVQSGQLTMSENRIDQLGRYVREHDTPYAGVLLRTLMSEEEQLLRDADRGFVMSLISFWKDFASHSVKDSCRLAMHALGLEFTPRNFLACRAANFYSDTLQLSAALRDVIGSLDSRLAPYNEGGGLELQYTPAGQRIVDRMFERRAAEVRSFEVHGYERLLAELNLALLDEMHALTQGTA